MNNKCPYCGNNPIPHASAWYFESINILFAPLRRGLFYNPLSKLCRRLWQKAGLSNLLVDFFVGLGAVSYRDDISACKVERAKVLWEDAGKRGVVMKELLLFGKPFDVYTAESLHPSSFILHPSKIKDKGLKIVFSGLPRPAGYDDSVLETLDDKAELKKNFLRAGLPVPAGASASSYRRARKIFHSLNKPVIVKPRSGSRGRHSTTYVRNEEDLKRAFKIARQLCRWVIVEEQLLGPVYRATVIDYKLRGVLRGDPPEVLGDGRSAVRDLIKNKNLAPHPGVKDILAAGPMEEFLDRELGDKFQMPDAGHKLARSPFDYVPARDEVVQLSEKIGVNYGGSSSEELKICHPDNIELFKRAAIAAGDPIVGFDFIIPDITSSYRYQRCGFIEANSLPFINLHHEPLLGRPENVASAVWDLVGF